MKITKIKSRWNEEKGFFIDRPDIGDEYIFIHFLTPVSLLADGEIIPVKPGTFVIHNKHSHQYFKSDDTPLCHDWFHLKGNIDDKMEAFDLKYDTPYEMQNPTQISKLITEIENEVLTRLKFSDKLLDLKLDELLLKISRNICETDVSNKINEETLTRFLVFRAEMLKEYMKNHTIDEMSRRVGFSRSRFCKLYNDIFRTSPIKDLQSIRIEQAKLFLLQRKYSVTEVAELCGFSNRYHFIRTFKKHVGITPGKYQK